MSPTHTIYLRLALAILLLGVSFLMSMAWIELPYLHYMVLILAAFVVSPMSGGTRKAKSGWHAFFTIAVIVTISVIQQAWRARTGTEFVDTLWWKIPVHLWFLGIFLMEAPKAIRSARAPQIATTG